MYTRRLSAGGFAPLAFFIGCCMTDSLALNRDTFRKLIWKSERYSPSDDQARFHASKARLKLVAGGVRGGKSKSTAREIDQYSITEGGLGWLVGPDYDQSRPEFEYLLEAYAKLDLVDKDSVSLPARGPAKFETKWGFKWQTKSSTDPVSLASYAPDVVVMCEAAQQSHEAFMKCVERATEKNAPVILTGTFESSLGWYADMWGRWQAPNPEGGESFSIPSWSNSKIFPGGREDKKIKDAEAAMPPDLFMERYGGIPCKPTGLVFPDFDRRRHLLPVTELYDPDIPVEIWCDPATHVYAILFVQVQKERVCVIDEIYGVDIIGQDIIPKVVAKPWWEKSCLEGVIDIAARQRHGNINQIEVWQTELKRLGTHGINWKSNYVKEEYWRDAIKLRLNPPGSDEPLLLFADHLNSSILSTGMAQGILGELLTYKWRPWNEGKSVSTRPVKQNEDALSALGYGLVHHFGPVVQRKAAFEAQIARYWG